MIPMRLLTIMITIGGRSMAWPWSEMWTSWGPKEDLVVYIKGRYSLYSIKKVNNKNFANISNFVLHRLRPLMTD